MVEKETTLVQFHFLELYLPTAAVGLVPAGRTTPNRMHPKHFGSASVADNRTFI